MLTITNQVFLRIPQIITIILTILVTTAPLAVTSTTPVANLSIGGNAATATKLAATKNINGVAFDGSTDITVATAANTLTGTTLASNVVNSSLTSVGTITSGTWNGTTIAIANGGIFVGLGPGNSKARNYLPQAYNDSIYAIIIEEYGLFGGAVVVFLYLLFLYRCIRIFKKCPYAFGAFLSLALSFTLVIQAMANMAVNVGLMPVTGVTLPLISMGGTSLLFTCAAIGIILSVARNIEQIETQPVAMPAADKTVATT